MSTTLSYFKCRKVRSPEYGTWGSAGIDFFVPEDLRDGDLKTSPSLFSPWTSVEYDEKNLSIEKMSIRSGEGVVIPSGIKVCVPPRHALLFLNKSGIALKKGLVQGAQLIDEDYMGEVHLHLVNTSNYTIEIKAGEKIAQGVVIPIMHCGLNECNSEEETFKSLRLTSDRADGAFGSTGNGLQ
jgi:dUTP pyrophosphatase